jgi:hypothetical protein
LCEVSQQAIEQPVHTAAAETRNCRCSAGGTTGMIILLCKNVFRN